MLTQPVNSLSSFTVVGLHTNHFLHKYVERWGEDDADDSSVVEKLIAYVSLTSRSSLSKRQFSCKVRTDPFESGPPVVKEARDWSDASCGRANSDFLQAAALDGAPARDACAL